jgi:hypothetical protein
MDRLLGSMAGLLVIMATVSFVLPVLRPHSRLSRFMLRAYARERVSGHRWRYVRAQLLLLAAGQYSMAAMFFSLVIAGGPGRISDAGIALMVAFGLAGIVLPIAGYLVFRRSREA